MSHGRFRNLPRALFLIVLLLTLLPLSSCNTSEEDDKPVSIPGNDTLVLFGSDPSTLDPSLSQEISSHTYITQIFSGLVSLDRDMNLVPDIAESWDISEEGNVYTFRLRQDVKFHSGDELTAADFKYSWERTCNPDTGSSTAVTYLGDISGAKEMLAGETEELEGVEVIEKYTLRVTVEDPASSFLSKLTYPAAFVVDEDNVESREDWWKEPNGTGPFKLEGWEEDKLILLERNEAYYRNKAGVGHVAFRLSGGTAMQLYEMDYIDVTYVSLWNLDRVMDDSNPLHQELAIFPELSLSYIGFNTSEPPFDNPDVRRAFCYAVDKDRVIGQVLKNSVSQADTIVPTGMPGYDEDVLGLSYDPDKAAELLGDTDLPVLTFTTPGDGGYLSPSLTAILWQWHENLGVEIEVRQLESEAYFPQLDEEKDDMFYYGWVADYADPQNFLEVLFGSRSENNKGEYENTRVDNLLAQAAAEMDSQARLDLYLEAEQAIVDDAACLPLWFGQNYVLIKPYVKDYFVSPLGIPMLSEVYLED